MGLCQIVQSLLSSLQLCELVDLEAPGCGLLSGPDSYVRYGGERLKVLLPSSKSGSCKFSLLWLECLLLLWFDTHADTSRSATIAGNSFIPYILGVLLQYRL